jgi:hypothetical protein
MSEVRPKASLLKFYDLDELPPQQVYISEVVGLIKVSY